MHILCIYIHDSLCDDQHYCCNNKFIVSDVCHQHCRKSHVTSYIRHDITMARRLGKRSWLLCLAWHHAILVVHAQIHPQMQQYADQAFPNWHGSMPTMQQQHQQQQYWTPEQTAWWQGQQQHAMLESTYSTASMSVVQDQQVEHLGSSSTPTQCNTARHTTIMYTTIVYTILHYSIPHTNTTGALERPNGTNIMEPTHILPTQAPQPRRMRSFGALGSTRPHQVCSGEQ